MSFVPQFASLTEAETFLRNGIGLDFVNGKKLVDCFWQAAETDEDGEGRFLFETVDGSCFAQPFSSDSDSLCDVTSTVDQTVLLAGYVMGVPNAYDMTAEGTSSYSMHRFYSRLQQKMELDRKKAWCMGTRSTTSAISTFSEHPLSAFRDMSDTIFKLAYS
jgi:hypothetical protein